MGIKKKARRGNTPKESQRKESDSENGDEPSPIVGYGGKEYESLGSALHRLGANTPIGMITNDDEYWTGNYVGTVNEKGEYEDQGRLTKENGDVIEGIWRGGVPHGQCRMEFANGEVHDGEWVDGLIVYGTVTYSEGDGEHYVGQLKSNSVEGTLKHGEGVYHYANGQRYEGEFADDLPHGEGVFYDESGRAILRGIWRRGAHVDEGNE